MFCVLGILNFVSWQVIRDDIKLILALGCFMVSSLLACSLSDDTDAFWCIPRPRRNADDIYADV